jgi:hypothetical protein
MDSLTYSAWLYFTFHYYIHIPVYIGPSSLRYSVSVSNGGRPTSFGFLNCPHAYAIAALD